MRALILAAVLAAAAPPGGYVWHIAEPGRSVQYGVPQTDDRAFRIDCSDGLIEMMRPMDSDTADGTDVEAMLREGAIREGRIAYLGDGANLVVTVAADDPVLAAMLANGRMVIDTASSRYELSVDDQGRTMIGALLRACDAKR
ncbi:MAG TPA: hypothetical protein VES64_01350 [Allosphingosinicella sp.]|nr:hypothetical protein [Allosphingosinicella sp.]